MQQSPFHASANNTDRITMFLPEDNYTMDPMIRPFPLWMGEKEG